VIDYSLIFVTGLLSSLHCIGMCGPIVLAYSLSSGGPKGAWPLHAAYNGGRIISYTLLGAAVGLAGQAFTSLETVGEYVSIAGGGLMVVAGIFLLGLIPVPESFTRWFKRPSGLLSGLFRSTSTYSKLTLGLLTPLLPCGILYAMAIKAATAHSVLGGALTMALFALGMVPALMLMGSFSTIFSARVRKGAEQMAAAAVILMGVILVLRGLDVPYLSWLSAGESSCPCGNR